MNKRLAVLAGAIALSVIPLTAQAQTDGATTPMMPAAECDHSTMDDPGHVGFMASTMGGDHIVHHARPGVGHDGHGHMHISEIASRPGQFKSGRLGA